MSFELYEFKLGSQVAKALRNVLKIICNDEEPSFEPPIIDNNGLKLWSYKISNKDRMPNVLGNQKYAFKNTF